MLDPMTDFMPRRTRVSRTIVLPALAGITIGCLLLAACSRRQPAADTQTLRIAQRNEPATLDSQRATLPDEFFIIRALSEGLLVPNPAGGTPLPGVAERYEISPDGLVYTFHLRHDAKWSNGEPVTSAGFARMILGASAAGSMAPKAHLFAMVREVKDPDPHTLVITLRRPMRDFPAVVASGPWLLPRYPAMSAHTHIGNGPFTLAEWLPNQRIVVRKNPSYWDAGSVKLDAIHFLAFDNGDTEERAFRAGQVDVTMAVPSPKLDTNRRDHPGLLHSAPLHETRFLVVNTRRAPLSDPRVRRALSLALDRPALVDKVLKAGQRPALNFVPAGLGGYVPATFLAEDAAEARRLLAEAGFPEGRGFPRLELATWPVSTAQLEAVQQRWRDQLGIEVAIAQREAKTHLASLAAGDFDLGFYTAIPDYDGAGDLFARLTTGHPDNHSGWSDPEYDRLVAAGGAALAGAETRLLESLPVIPLYLNTKNFLLRPTVRGWKEDALWTRYYKHVSLHEN